VKRVFLIHSWRSRWRGLVVLAVIVGMTGGATIAALTGARRSATALDRFAESAQTLDVFISADMSSPEPDAMRELLDGPLVESTNDLVFLMVDSGSVGAVMFAPTSRRGLRLEQGVLLAGRRADPDEPDEVALAETTARAADVDVGDTIEAGSLSPAQTEVFFSGGEEPTSLDGPTLRLQVVGIVRNGFDLTNRADGTGLVLTTPAFWETYGDGIGVGSRSHWVRLVDEPGAVERFTDAVEVAYGNENLPSMNIGQGEKDAVADTISLITAALVAVGLIVGMAGIVWIFQATARHQRLVTLDFAALRALGATVGERRALLLGSVVPGLTAGLLIAALIAVALSPLFPVGTARRFDPDPGLHVDALTFVAGGLILVVVLVAIAAMTSARLVSRRRRTQPDAAGVPSVVDRAARALRPALGTGVRFALHAPPRAGAPVRSALAGALVGVVGLVAVAVVGTNLRRAVDTPDRWGTTWDIAIRAEALVFGDASFVDEDAPSDGVIPALDRQALVDDPQIESAAILLYDEQITINGVEAISMTLDSVKGGITPTIVDGREPRADDEIALGSATLRDVGVELGTTVTVSGRRQASGDFRVVGVIAFPTIGEPTPVGIGAALTARGGDRLLLSNPAPSGGDFVASPYVVVRWAPGVDHDEALGRWGLEEDMTRGIDVLTAGPTPPPEMTGLRDVEWFPLIAGIGLVAVGLIATGHALIVTVRRRRLEIGVLSALGVSPAQRRTVIHAQATTIALTALVIGLPLGAVLGRVLWSAVAGSIGLVPDVSFPLALLAAGAIGLVVALNTVAAFPARSAQRLGIADVLRAE
jgi:hypothetical protein